ncbi:hypothetical protein EDC14_100332 [Hydrogenispora ethanolica]|uniref:Uncharacterized protein n=1 Tax=Hydrogenispora ethanolica TaxID=1082276 RepID=A0A4R1S9B6_HYDET|nr:hypothetical protein EDC14_100332 [Hydrogenispora ethanolica]
MNPGYSPRPRLPVPAASSYAPLSGAAPASTRDEKLPPVNPATVAATAAVAFVNPDVPWVNEDRSSAAQDPAFVNPGTVALTTVVAFVNPDVPWVNEDRSSAAHDPTFMNPGTVALTAVVAFVNPDAPWVNEDRSSAAHDPTFVNPGTVAVIAIVAWAEQVPPLADMPRSPAMRFPRRFREFLLWQRFLSSGPSRTGNPAGCAGLRP